MIKNKFDSCENFHKSISGARIYDPLDKFPQISANKVLGEFFTQPNQISETENLIRMHFTFVITNEIAPNKILNQRKRQIIIKKCCG